MHTLGNTQLADKNNSQVPRVSQVKMTSGLTFRLQANFAIIHNVHTCWNHYHNTASFYYG